jgi:sulfite reductase (NADPH) flavoprotein alpha-component
MTLKINPLNEQQLSKLNEVLNELTPEQMIWVAGYMEGRLVAGGSEAATGAAQTTVSANTQSNTNLTILYGTETGNAIGLAEKLAEKAAFNGINAKVLSMYDYKTRDLKNEENLAVIVSTHGEGDPPDMAADFYKFISGKRAPELKGLSYSVLALGDKTYRHFCKTGEEIDKALKTRGAFAAVPMVKCDVDYEQDADIWMNTLMINLAPAETPDLPKPLNGTPVAIKTQYNKKNPFKATVLEKVKLSGRGSDKEVYHVELSLEDSGLIYEPGDSVGIFTKNPESLVNQIIEKCGFDPKQKVDVNENEVSLNDALSHHFEITLLTFDLLNKYAERTRNKKLKKLLDNEAELDEYLFGHDLLDLLEDFPFEWNVHKLIEILRPLPPRLYSISSSQESVGEEVHATISVVRYERKNRHRVGACSSYLADSIQIDGEVPVYIEKNPSFKLPGNGAPIIMVGAGTGIAPYRAFMQQREVQGQVGDSWLFFGDRRFDSDFLYQTEWQKLLENETLERMDVAFSRDQEEKIYVQNKLAERQDEVFEWLENGAHFYLCGDMKYMAKDVNKTLLEIIQAQGGVDQEQAERYLKMLKREKRFQTDVY